MKPGSWPSIARIYLFGVVAFWSRYTPVGIALGLLMAARFAGTGHWRGSYLLHMVLFAVLAAAGMLLPRVPRRPRRTASAGLFAVWTQVGPLRLSLTFAVLVVMGFGLNTVFLSWCPSQHPAGRGVEVARSMGR
ncbi:hypothetical protein WME79_29390 [Sorangium sp. So ce726]|uniref:hypothetical protein n=1 Tax=Sorangium sp. So ce726 TaxID=3133319 RepID=UPI003F61D729